MTESAKLRAFNPVELSPSSLEILTYMLDATPEFFDQFERYFNEILTEEDKLAIDKVARIVVLLHYLRDTVHGYKHAHFVFDLSVYTTCKKILTFLLYTLILDERIVLTSDGRFVANMVELMESAVF
jgi:hypothetical protein